MHEVHLWCTAWPLMNILLSRSSFDIGPWNFYHFVCLVAQSCPTHCDPRDCSPPGSSVHGISQARILEWVAMLSSRGSLQPRDWTQVSCKAGRFFYCLSQQGPSITFPNLNSEERDDSAFWERVPSLGQCHAILLESSPVYTLVPWGLCSSLLCMSWIGELGPWVLLFFFLHGSLGGL